MIELDKKLVSDTAYNATSWNGITTIAPSKNAVRDQFELLDAAKQPLALTSVPASAAEGVLTSVTITGVTPSAANQIYPIVGWDGSSSLYVTSGEGRLSYSSFNGRWDVQEVGTSQGMQSVFESAFSASPGAVSTWESMSGGGSGTVVATDTFTPVPADPVPTTIGQSAIVTHSDSTKTEWAAASLTEWLPRTAGIVKNRTTGVWERTFIADSTIQTEILPDQ